MKASSQARLLKAAAALLLASGSPEWSLQGSSEDERPSPVKLHIVEVKMKLAVFSLTCSSSVVLTCFVLFFAGSEWTYFGK